MAKRDDFIAVVKRVKSTLSTITDDQRIKLLRQGKQDYGLTQQQAEKILKDEGLTVDQTVNYFKVLKLDIKDIESKSGDTIREVVEKQHTKLDKPLQGDANPQNRKKRDLLKQAKTALLNPKTRKEHIDSIKSGTRPKHNDLLFTFATTSITRLATLMEGDTSKATEILYSGDLAKCLTGRLASAARAVVREFPG